jgi:adenine-specific DNA-methyltransferase
VIKYIGSKRELVPLIVKVVTNLAGVRSVLDPFSGTARVSHALKREQFAVIANDHNAYAATLAICYVQADREKVERRARRLIADLNRLPPKPGYFTQTFCVQANYFMPKNGERIDAIREAIERKDLERDLKAVALTSLMEAADRVDSTTGLQMAYLKQWAPRASNPIELRLPDLLPRAAHGPGKAYQLEAQQAAERFAADLAYVDPPYNQHSYLGNYHIWESLVLWDKPEVYGVANKRIDCRERRSDFNSKRRFKKAFQSLLGALRAKYLLVSFNNEGYMDKTELYDMLRTLGEIVVFEVDYKRYVGAQIGIYSPKGVKVGKISHLRNKEHLFLCGPRLSVRNWQKMIQSDPGVQIVDI